MTNLQLIDCEATSKWTHLSIISRSGGEILGMVEVIWPKEAKDRTPYICGLFVKESSRRHGYARTLIRRSIELCRERNSASVWLTVHNENAAAIALYASEGFFQSGYDAGTGNFNYVKSLAPKV